MLSLSFLFLATLHYAALFSQAKPSGQQGGSYQGLSGNSHGWDQSPNHFQSNYRPYYMQDSPGNSLAFDSPDGARFNAQVEYVDPPSPRTPEDPNAAQRADALWGFARGFLGQGMTREHWNQMVVGRHHVAEQFQLQFVQHQAGQQAPPSPPRPNRRLAVRRRLDFN